MKTGTVFDIQRFSIGNGPGIRTTVFLKGCSLHCKWCHNPEAFSSEKQLRVNRKLCCACGLCATVCPNQVHVFERETVDASNNENPSDHLNAVSNVSDGPVVRKNMTAPPLNTPCSILHSLHTDKCTLCGKCVDVCCHGYIELAGCEYTSAALADLLKKDLTFYAASGGGITFSGGEPMLQYDLIEETARNLDQNISIYLDTCGFCPEVLFQKAAASSFITGFLFDLKHMDSNAHQRLTGNGNELILRNFETAVQCKKPMQVRFPMIKDANDSAENIEKMCLFLKQHGIFKLEVMPYHDYGVSKYGDLGLSAVSFPKYSEEEIKKKTDLIRFFGMETEQI